MALSEDAPGRLPLPDDPHVSQPAAGAVQVDPGPMGAGPNGAPTAPAPRPSPESRFLPPRPRNLAETGLSPSFLSDMVLKIMHFSTQLPAYELATRMRLDYECIHQVI